MTDFFGVDHAASDVRHSNKATGALTREAFDRMRAELKAIRDYDPREDCNAHVAAYERHQEAVRQEMHLRELLSLLADVSQDAPGYQREIDVLRFIQARIAYESEAWWTIKRHIESYKRDAATLPPGPALSRTELFARAARAYPEAMAELGRCPALEVKWLDSAIESITAIRYHAEIDDDDPVEFIEGCDESIAWVQKARAAAEKDMRELGGLLERCIARIDRDSAVEGTISWASGEGRGLRRALRIIRDEMTRAGFDKLAEEPRHGIDVVEVPYVDEKLR